MMPSSSLWSALFSVDSSWCRRLLSGQHYSLLTPHDAVVFSLVIKVIVLFCWLLMMPSSSLWSALFSVDSSWCRRLLSGHKGHCSLLLTPHDAVVFSLADHQDPAPLHSGERVWGACSGQLHPAHPGEAVLPPARRLLLLLPDAPHGHQVHVRGHLPVHGERAGSGERRRSHRVGPRHAEEALRQRVSTRGRDLVGVTRSVQRGGGRGPPHGHGNAVFFFSIWKQMLNLKKCKQ